MVAILASVDRIQLQLVLGLEIKKGNAPRTINRKSLLSLLQGLLMFLGW